MLEKDKCENRIDKELEKEIAELERMYYAEDDETQDEFSSHALCFDFVAPNTFEDQARGYHRGQLSWGGPSDEVRFYTNDEDGLENEFDYVFLEIHQIN